jgi:autotransporter-associated beta strand protein
MKTDQPNPTKKFVSKTLSSVQLNPIIPHRALAVFFATALGLLVPAALQAAVTSDTWLGAGDSQWSTPANWSLGSAAGPNNAAMLTNTAATGLPGTNGMGAVGTPNITVTANTSVGQLWIVNSNYNNTLASYHTIGISPGVSLTVSNTGANLNSPNILQVMSSGGYQTLFGGNGVSGNSDPHNTIYATIQGGAGSTLNVICTNSLNSSWTTGSGNITVEQGVLTPFGVSDPLMATLDLSGLDNFNAYVNHLCVGADGGSGAYYFERPNGTLYLGKTNNITLWAVGTFPNEGATQGLLMGIIAQNNGGGLYRIPRILLGLTNSIYCDTGLGLGLRGCGGYIGFNTNNAPGTSTVYFRNKAGTGRQSLWSLGDRTGTAGSTSQIVKGELDFSLGSVDAMVTTLRMGISAVEAQACIGVLEFGAGTIDVNTLVLGCQTVAGKGPAQGTITVSNTAVLKINTSAQIGTIAGTPVAGSYFGQIIITNGGSVQFGNTTAITCGTGNSEIDVVNGSGLTVGTVGSPSAPLTTLTVISNNTLTIDLGTLPNPSVAPVQVSTLNSAGTNTINIPGTGLIKGRITLIKYGTWNNDGGTLPCVNFVKGTNSPGVSGYITNNPANSSIDFVVTVGTATSLVWDGQVGGIPNGAWDINLTPDWRGAQKYTEVSIPGSMVQFDDTATGTTTVVLSNRLAPVLMIVTNNAKTYTFTGTSTNALTGPGNLVKDGPGLMILNNTGTNDGTGLISINNGTLQIAGSDNRLPVGASVVLANVSTAALDLNGFNQTLGSISGGGTTGGNITEGSGALSITGSGNYGGVISGSGGLIKQTGGTLTLTSANLYSGGTIVSNGSLVVANTTGSGLGSGSVTIAAAGSVQLGDGLTANGSIAAAYITNNGNLNLLPVSDYTFTNLIVGSGRLTKLIGAGAAKIYITNDNTFTGGAAVGQGWLQISSPGALGTGTINIGNQTVDNAVLALSGGITVTNAITLSAKTGFYTPELDQIDNVDSTNTLTGGILLAGATGFGVGVDAGTLILTGNVINNQVANPGIFSLRGDGGNGVFAGAFNQGAGNPLELYKADAGTWTLAGTNYYTGPTIIAGGKLIVNGSIIGTTNLYVGSGATLGGTGTITANATTNDGTIFPGADPALSTLTINNLLVLNSGSQTTFNVSTNGNDEIRGMSTVIYGGTLNVNVLGTLTGACIFKLFDAAVYSGTFDGGYNLPDISPLAWDTSYLSVDGTLHATSGVVATPAVTSSGFSGGSFTMSGTGTLVAPYSILATTNLATPLVNWSNIGGGTFSNGTFFFVDPAATNFPQRFYRLSTPTP